MISKGKIEENEMGTLILKKIKIHGDEEYKPLVHTIFMDIIIYLTLY